MNEKRKLLSYNLRPQGKSAQKYAKQQKQNFEEKNQLYAKIIL